MVIGRKENYLAGEMDRYFDCYGTPRRKMADIKIDGVFPDDQFEPWSYQNKRRKKIEGKTTQKQQQKKVIRY